MNDEDYVSDSSTQQPEIDAENPVLDSVAQQPTVDAEDQRKFEEWAERLKLSADDLKVFCHHGFHYEKIPPHDTPGRRMMLAHLKRAATSPPKWLLISGLYPEAQFAEPERQKRIRALYRALVLLIKRALAQHAVDAIEERSIYWDPVAIVCRDLEIAPSKLSSLCKEFSGNSLSQVIDCVRAERIKKLLRIHIRSFVQNHKTQCATLAEDSAIGKMDVWSVWKALKVSRRWPEFCQNTWAIEMGFASYRRLYRACLAVWKQTPHQLELAMIADCLKLNELQNAPESAVENELNLDQIQELVRTVIKVYADES